MKNKATDIEHDKKPKVMVHIIMPNQISGPNTSARLISNSYLKERYEFCFLTQKKHAGGKINISLIKDLVKQIKKESPDIIHLAGLQSSGFHALIAAKIAKHKSVITAVRGFMGDDTDLSKSKKFIFNRIIEPLTLYYSDVVYTVCNYAAKRRMIKKYARNFVGYIHNSAPVIDMTNHTNLIRKELGTKENDIIITAASRIVEDKGYKYLAEAIIELKEINPNLKYVIVGDGPYKKNIEEKLQDEIRLGMVHMLGHRNDVKEILKNSDIYVFPTLHENLSNSLLEACASKNAIIATNVGGNPEVIKDGKNGLLVPPSNSSAIRDSILTLVTNHEMRTRMSNAAYNTAINEFSKEKNFEKIEMIYKKLLAKNRN